MAIIRCPRCKLALINEEEIRCGICEVEIREVSVLCVMDDTGRLLAYGFTEAERIEFSADFCFVEIVAKALRRTIERDWL